MHSTKEKKIREKKIKDTHTLNRMGKGTDTKSTQRYREKGKLIKMRHKN